MDFEKTIAGLDEIVQAFANPPGPGPVLAELLKALYGRDQLLQEAAQRLAETSRTLRIYQTEADRLAGVETELIALKAKASAPSVDAVAAEIVNGTSAADAPVKMARRA